MFARRGFTFTLNFKKGRTTIYEGKANPPNSSDSSMTAARVNCNSPLCGGSLVSRQRKPRGLLQPARTLIRYHPSCKFFSPISDSQGRKVRRRLRIASLRGVQQHISGLGPSIPNITNRESVSLPCYPSPDIGPWVVCTGCFRNWVREGFYCWDCGYDC